MKEGEGVHSGQDEHPLMEEAFSHYIAGLSDEFDNQTIERHEMGREKYGPGKFLTVNTIDEALDELVDLSNYARYTYIKLRMMQKSLEDIIDAQTPPGQFVKAKDMGRL